MEASSSISPGIPPPPPSSMYSVKRSFSTPCDPREDEDGCNIHLSQRLAKTPPLTPKKGGKMLALKIHLLDDTVTIIQAQTKALGRVVFDQVCKQLNILEADYFGLEYQDSYGTKYWLDLEKRLSRQVGLSLGDPVLRFSVKFYTPDPSQLEEEFTRYLFSLQIKRDLATGILQCNDNTAALMASFIVQAECGDFNDEDYPDAGYLSTFKFVPHQDAEMEKRIRENHRKHVGQSPAEADLHLLETARRTELFGIKMHPAKDEEGVPLNLSVCHLGVVVFQNFTKINTFSWAKIRKISFKRKRFILKLHPEGFGYYKETVEFLFETRNECKSFWKRCVEHHAFFRCEKAPSSLSGSGRSKGLLTSRGSSFRYSGRTQKQMVAFVRENFVKRGAPPMGSSTFQRSASFRSAHNVMSSASMSVGGGGPHSGVSTSCSSPAMMSAASAVLPIDDQVMDRVYPNMDYPDSPVEIRSQDSQQDTLSPGTSVTSSPQRYVPAAAMQAGVIVDQVVGPPPPPVAVYHPQYPPQGQSISQSHSLAHTPELYEDDEELSDESFRSDVKRFGSFGQNEFPVTTVRNIEKKLKVFEAAQGMITSSISATTQLGSSASSNSKETIRRTRKQRSKSLTVRSEIVSEDDDELNNFFTIPRRKEKMQKRKVTDDEFHRPGDETTSQGSYDLLVSTERMDELSSRSRRLIHQKESLYDELDDPVMSPPAVMSTSATTPPTRTPPAIVTPARTPPKVVTTPTNATATSAPKKPEKRVLTLKSEEQLVEEAGIWLEAGAISTSGSVKRKLNKKKQEALEKLESEIIPHPAGRPGRERSRHQSRKEALSPRASLDRTSYRPHERYTRSHSSPIEVEVSIVPPPPPSDIPLIIPRKVKPPPPCDIPLKPTRNNINNNPLVLCPTKPLPPEPVKPIPKPRAAEEQQPHTNGTAEIPTKRDDKQQQQQPQQQQPEPKYLIPANEIIPLSKSFELEPVLEDTRENEPPVPDTPPAIPPNGSISSTARKNFVRKTKSEGAFDTASKPQSSLKRSSTEKKPGRGTERGETSGGRAGDSDEERPNKSSIHFEEVDVPYLLRRRIDLDYPSSTPGSTTNFYHHHESLSKSKSYGGTSTDGSSTSQQLKRLVYCSMTDLPPVTNFSWRDDTFDGPPIWDEIDPFSLAVRRGQRGGGGVPRANIRKIRSEEIETAATDLLDDIMKTVNVEFVKNLTEVHELIPPPMFQHPSDIETIQEEQESAPVKSGSEEDLEDDDDMMMSGSEEEISSEGEKVYEPEEFAKLAEELSAVYEEEEERVDERDLDKLSETEVCGESPEELDDDDVDDYNPEEENPEEEPEFDEDEEEQQLALPVLPPRQNSLEVPAESTPEICEETPGEGSISTVAEIPEIPEEEGDMSVCIVDDIEIPQELPAVLEDLAVVPAPASESPAIAAVVEGPGIVTVEDPVVETVEDPVVETVEDPVIETVEDPVIEAVEDPAKLTAEDPAIVPAEDPAIVPAEDPAGPTVAAASSSTVKAAGPPSPKPPVPEKPADLLLRKLRKDSTASLDDFPLPPLPDTDGEYNCETPRYPPPPPDILQFNYPSRRGSYNRRRSSADLEQGSITDSLTTVVENAALEIVNRRLHFSRTFSISDEDDNNSMKPVLPPRRSSVSDEANIPPAIAEEDPALISPATPLPPPPPVTISSHPPPLLASSTLSMADSFSKQSSSDSLPDPPDPLYDCVESRNSDTVSEKSESPEAPLFLNLAAGTIGFPRTLSRISERTHSSEETESTSQFIQKIESGLRKKLEEASSLSAMDDLDFPCMRKLSSNNDTSADLSGSLNAPLATLTSELADSSATLNDLEEINNEEVEDFVDDEVGNANLPTELKPEIVQARDEDGDEDDEDTFGAQEITRDDTTTTSQRHRVEVSLTVKDDPDWLHYICKEIMSTHRTFMTDLKVIGKPVSALLSPNSSLLHSLEGLVDIKKELWEAGSHGVQVISCLGKHFEHARLRYEEYFLGLQSTTFEEFIEAEDFSHYLPLTALALKPLYRILYYWQDVLPVFRTYETDTIRQHCSKLEVILSPLVSIVNSLQSDLESRAKIGELTREMPGCPSNPGKFLLQGILLKLSRRRGLQNRIFFLFNDYIMYGVRVSSAAGFRLHGIVPLYETEMQQNFELEHQLGSSIPHAFSLITQHDKVLVLAAMTEKDKILWMSALVDAIGKARPNQSSLKSIGYSSEELLLSGSQDGIVSSSENNNNVSTLLRNNNQVGHRSNATPHVCWHRNVSISHAELCKGFQCTISGFLLRKFKNSPGWQRLWVVFTNICLFFYKSFDDSNPLASLPLLGYRVETPVEEDGITKDHVFKLVFKNHVYFFRAESKFTFKRWMRALNQAIQLPGQYK